MVQGLVLASIASPLVQRFEVPAKVGGQQRMSVARKAVAPKHVVCHASAQPMGTRESKAMLASAALAGALLVLQVPECHAAAYPELFASSGISVEVAEAAKPPPAAAVILKAEDVMQDYGKKVKKVLSTEEKVKSVAIWSSVAAAAGFGVYSKFLRDEAAIELMLEQPEEYSAEDAAIRAAEASDWIASWQRKQEIKQRVGAAEAWVAQWRKKTEQLQRETRIAERAQWIAKWRASQEGTRKLRAAQGAAAMQKQNKGLPWLKKLGEQIKQALKLQPSSTL
eukprot:CAMPEP_0198198860 /NCGR_PEP_ID=MMETSP1445-20131203/2218_1 /TAXON_ID=36898 /ORGANISM="Pyramimonas sp., Strain CCMP2087" /LENGTH=280 /DNA_ID=CAMNT_0043868519 /DNA_START=118 /DNA_END=961 /DNA_ORIENTATION=-